MSAAPVVPWAHPDAELARLYDAAWSAMREAAEIRRAASLSLGDDAPHASSGAGGATRDSRAGGIPPYPPAGTASPTGADGSAQAAYVRGPRPSRAARAVPSTSTVAPVERGD